MNDNDLTQADADAFIEMEKRTVSRERYSALSSKRVEIPLTDYAEKKDFQLDIRRDRIDLKKGTNQMRMRKAIVLVRFDFGGAPHRNPDSEEIDCLISTSIDRGMETNRHVLS